MNSKTHLKEYASLLIRQTAAQATGFLGFVLTFLQEIFFPDVFVAWGFLLVTLGVAVVVGGYCVYVDLVKKLGTNLRVDVKYILQTGQGTSFLVELTNCGQRPVTIRGVFLNLKSGGQVSHSKLTDRYGRLPVTLSRTLLETEFDEFLFPLYYMSQIEGKEITESDVASAEAVDSLGQRHKVSYKKPPT